MEEAIKTMTDRNGGSQIVTIKKIQAVEIVAQNGQSGKRRRAPVPLITRDARKGIVEFLEAYESTWKAARIAGISQKEVLRVLREHYREMARVAEERGYLRGLTQQPPPSPAMMRRAA